MADQPVFGDREEHRQLVGLEPVLQVQRALDLEGDVARELPSKMDFHVTSIVIRQRERDFENAVAGNDQDLCELVLGDDALLREGDGAHGSGQEGVDRRIATAGDVFGVLRPIVAIEGLEAPWSGIFANPKLVDERLQTEAPGRYLRSPSVASPARRSDGPAPAGRLGIRRAAARRWRASDRNPR